MQEVLHGGAHTEPARGPTLGARVEGARTRFALYTSQTARPELRLFDADLRPRTTLPMNACGDGMFELSLPDAGHGTLYKFVLDGQELPDPYARFLPHGVHGPAMVVEPRYRFRHGKPGPRPLSREVIYELHVGTFTPEGTYAAAAARLDELVRLGVTTLELMPVAAFAGSRGWGYDGVALYAPFAGYGTPDELRALVDAAHGHGLRVLLDVVYNHFGPAGNYLHAYSPDYFSKDLHNAWGDAPNYAHPVMRAFVLDNASYWLEEFRFDGLRLDAVHAIVDASEKHVLEELVERVRARPEQAVLIAEDDRNEPALIERVGLDAVWADDFHHQARVTLTGERDGYYGGYEPGVKGLAHAINHGFVYEGQTYPTSGKTRGRPAHTLPAEAFVYCIQNHDQVGNRALGDRLSESVSLDAYCMLSSLLLFLPMTPLLFMGQEWAASTPFLYFTDHDPELGRKVSAGRREEFKHFQAFSNPEQRERIPDPQDTGTFERSRLRWEEREEPRHARVLTLYRQLLSLRRDDAVLRASGREGLRAEAHGDVLLVFRRLGDDARCLIANFGKGPCAFAALPLPAQTTVLASSTEYHDVDHIAPEQALIVAFTEGARA